MKSDRLKIDLIIIVFITGVFSLFYFSKAMIKDFFGFDFYMTLFITSPEFKPQISYFGSILMHNTELHLLVNLVMVITSVLYLNRKSTIKFTIFMFIISGSSALIGYSLISQLIGYHGYAVGSSGVAYGLLANSHFAKLEKFDVKKICKYSMITILIFSFEFLRATVLNIDATVSSNPMSNVAHICSIIMTFTVMIVYIRIR